jgi:hypothetical protein
LLLLLGTFKKIKFGCTYYDLNEKVIVKQISIYVYFFDIIPPPFPLSLKGCQPDPYLHYPESVDLADIICQNRKWPDERLKTDQSFHNHLVNCCTLDSEN